MSDVIAGIVARALDYGADECGYDLCNSTRLASYMLTALKKRGYVVAPVVPTKERVQAAYDVLLREGIVDDLATSGKNPWLMRIVAAMLAAATQGCAGPKSPGITHPQERFEGKKE